jgi:MerR family transcriptional regulator, thiopeptide resistance regulator
VGELAAATGLTVRTLHYYEQIGLLAPSARSQAGHRLYGAEAVDRLYRIGLLRRLGFSLEEIARALDDPAWNLRAALTHHHNDLEHTLATVARLRASLGKVLSSIENTDTASTTDLLAVVEDMTMVDTPLQQRISILVYADLQKAYEYLIDVFGLASGQLSTDANGRVVHAELIAGDGVVWLHPETTEFRLASPRSLGAATATMAVMVDDVDDHFRRAKAKGAEIVYEPVDQPYGYREYSARDCEGGLWSFMKPVD